MGDGKALQMGTSHQLGQNFARAFGIDYLPLPGSENWRGPPPWGITTALSAASSWLIGDDLGLRVPPGWPRCRPMS